ncbi:MAG: CPBP family intramembrane metalloprotease [Cryomorphaceae bacterium]|nr:CPBP family intramembrane metalloprotease [Cryomorphaceae bacterium]
MRNTIGALTPGGKLIILLLACMVAWLMATAILFALVPVFFGISINQVPQVLADANMEEWRYLMMYLQGGSSLGLFVGGALLYGYYAEQEQSIGFNWASQSNVYTFFGVFVTLIVLLGLLPMVDLLERLNHMIVFPESLSFFETYLRERHDVLSEQIGALIHIESVSDFLLATLVLAVIPAVGEEWVFRGKLQGLLQRVTGSSHGGVWLTSLIFALFHQQFFALLPMMFLALFLSYIYAYTRSLWMVVAVHFVNNFASLLFVYFNNGDMHQQVDLPLWSYVLSGFLLLGGIILLIFQWKKLGVYGPFASH